MNTALLIIDIQNDYFEGGKMPLTNPEQAAQNAKLILDKFRKNKWPVVHIQHISLRPGSTFFLPETEGAKIHNSVQPIEGEKIITKKFPNGFRETDLLEYLENQKIRNIVICGMMTHMCIDATVRAAKDVGFECTLIGDACATRDLDVNQQKIKAIDVHNSFLAALSYYYTTVLTTKEYLKE